MGVEVNAWDRPVAYHLFQRNPYDYPYGTVIENRLRVVAEDILHLFIQERPTQTRGYPWATSVMMRMSWLKGYEEAELVSSRESASKGGFIKSQKTTEPPVYDGKDSRGNLIERVEPGTAYINLPPGTEFQPYDPQHPTGNFAAFSKEILRGISSGMNLNYHIVANDLETTNYNSIRAGVNVDKDYYRELQGWIVDHLCEDVFPDWLKMGLLSGAINLPAQKLDKLNYPKWIPRGFTYIDPQREVVSDLTSLQSGFTTRSRIVAEQGLDYEELLLELKHEKELETENGIEFIPQETGNPKFTVHITPPGD
jgi:lambda family phage portal protein